MPTELRNLDLPGVLYLRAPRAAPLPLFFDSPHSGTVWPEDFRPAAPEAVLRRTEDSFVDELFESAPDYGAPLIAGLFPRVYIDPNRALDDLDPELLAAPWPEPLQPGEKTDLGKGLIWRKAAPGQPVYGERLPVSAVQARIARYWQPYHVMLAHAADALAGEFDQVWHVDCHSMKGTSTAMDKEGPGIERPDIVLSDREGTSCDSAFIAAAADYWRSTGLRVAINDPFKGAEICRRMGDPARRRHSLQIEFKRRLYMDEAGMARSAGFARLQEQVDGFIRAMAEFVRRRPAG